MHKKQLLKTNDRNKQKLLQNDLYADYTKLRHIIMNNKDKFKPQLLRKYNQFWTL